MGSAGWQSLLCLVANCFDDLLLFCRGELGQAERLVLHFDLAGAAQIEFIVRLDRDRWQKCGGHEHKQAG